MGQFIDIGLVLTIETNLNPKTTQISPKDLSEVIEKNFNIGMNLYTIDENNLDHIVFGLSPSYLGEPLVNFIKEQAQMSKLFRISDEVAESFMAIHDVRSLKEYLEDKYRDKFQVCDFGRYRIDESGLSFVAKIEALSLAMAGKILLEEGEAIFDYFERNIQLQKHPIAKAIKVQIIG